MKKGFTLIELMIVIIIIGILATVGIVQYQAAVEKSRGSEAKSVLGFLRDQCAAIWMETNSTANCNNTSLNLGMGATNIPDACTATRKSHWFQYDVVGSPSGATISFTATRCTGANGKNPGGTAANVLQLDADYAAGSGTFVGQSNY